MSEICILWINAVICSEMLKVTIGIQLCTSAAEIISSLTHTSNPPTAQGHAVQLCKTQKNEF